MSEDHPFYSDHILMSDAKVSPFLFLRLFLPLALLLAGGAIFYGKLTIERELTLLRAPESTNVRLGAGALFNRIEFIGHDLTFLSRYSALRNAIDQPSPENLTRLTEDFTTFSASSGHYDQIRWIGEDGMERVRIDYVQGKPVAVTADKLQNKGQRYFFTDTIKLNPGEVFVSPLDLNIEQNRIEVPYKPMIRVATPVADRQRKKRGIVILNYYGNELLQAFADATASTAGHGMLINNEGYWLKSHNPADEWGFMFKRPELSMAARAPAAWERIRGADRGQAELDDGLWTWDTVYPLLAGHKTSSGSADAFAPSRGELESRQYFWKLITHHPAEALHIIRRAAWLKVGGIAALLLALAGLGSWLLARSWNLLAQARIKYRTVADFAYDWETWIAPDGHYIYCSPSCARITGRPASAFIADPNLLLDIIHPDDREHMKAHLQLYERSAEPYETTIRIILPNGEMRWLEHACQPVYDEAGKFLGRRGSNRDVSKRKEYEEELQRSNIDLEQFAYAVSHDMRQPLRMISSYLQLLEMSLTGQLDGEKRDHFNFAIEGAKRIDQMLVALLEYSRVGRMGEPPTWVDSRTLLDEALQYLQPAIAEARAVVEIGGEWPRIHVSHDEVLRLIQNLIGNALKYRVAGRVPEISVTSKVTGKEWQLCVADNGVGIVPGQAKRLFQVFQRLHSREAYEGTGIGLALCRKIAEHHKGRIWAESAGEGRGSRFYVVLPVLYKKLTLQ